jgi:hypothetical protein
MKYKFLRMYVFLIGCSLVHNFQLNVYPLTVLWVMLSEICKHFSNCKHLTNGLSWRAYFYFFTQSLCWMMQFPDSIAIGLCTWSAPIICQGKAVLNLSFYALHYKYACAFLKVNKLFKRLTNTVDAQNISLLPLNNSVLNNMGCNVCVAILLQLQFVCLTLKTYNCIYQSK